MLASLRRVAARLMMSFSGGRADREIQDELEAHVTMLTDEYLHRGMAADEARRQALIRLGNIASLAQQHREARGLPFAETIRQDLSYSWRIFRRSPLFFGGTVLTLALAIGANGAVFGIVRAVLLQPLPYRDPDRVVMVWRGRTHPGRHQHFGDLALRAHVDANEAIESATYQSWQDVPLTRFDLQLGDRAVRVNGAAATTNFFDILGVSAARGRLFSPTDEASGARVLVLSDALWRRTFGADPSVVGRAVTLLSGWPKAARSFTVIGVLPPGVHVTYPEETEAWTVLPWSGITTPNVYWTIARLRDGQSLASAQARLATIPAGDPERGREPETFMLEPIRDWVVGDTRPSLMLLASVAGLLLLVACATVASALFVRITARQQELALRAAIGAGRRRLAQQLLTEGFLLSLIAAAAGCVLASLTGPILRTVMPASIPRADEVGVNVWIVAFFAAAAGAATILAALAPAWRGARIDVVSFFKRGPAGGSPDRSAVRWRHGLIAVQSAMATALLLAAALLLVSFWRLTHMPLGFDAERVLTVELELDSPKYVPVPAAGSSRSAARSQSFASPTLITFEQELLTRVRALPGVVDAGTTSALPFRNPDRVTELRRADATNTAFGLVFYVDPGYLSALEVPVLEGRDFTGADTMASPPVVIVSSRIARSLFGTEHPIGKLVQMPGPRRVMGTVIGVVGEIRYQSFDTDPNQAIYFPQAQSTNRRICLAVRLTPAARNIDEALRAIVRDLDPDLPVISMTRMDQVLSASIAERRFYTMATTSLASLALILTVVGLVIVISRTVVERHRELAIRSALGATSLDLIRAVALQGMAPVLVGIAAGIGVVFAGAAPLQQFLFHTAPRPPMLYADVALLVFAVALAATLIPARRAHTVSPSEMLKAE